MNKKTVLVTAAALLAAGCSIPYAEELAGPTNICASDNECPASSVCADVDGSKTCVAQLIDLSDIVFEVQPAIGNGEKSASSLVKAGSLLAGDGGQVINFNPRLPQYINVTPGRVFLPCAPDVPVPAKVTFQPVAKLAGLLAGQAYHADSKVDAESNDTFFQASIPPGTYNIYLEPKPDPMLTPDCAAAPPIFLLEQDINDHTGFGFHAAEPLVLKGLLTLSSKEDFTKWYLEVVESFSGQTISEVVQPKQMGISLQVPFQIKFDWTAREAITPVIRLRPPEGQGKPTIHWRLDAVAIQGIQDGEVPVALDVSGIDTQPRPVGGFVTHEGQGVPATVTLRSRNISGDELTRYETVVETNAGGKFDSALPPGEYDVIARPHQSDLATFVKRWKIVKADTCFCANTVDVPPATTLSGAVLTPSGEPASAEVRLAPAAAADIAYLGNVLDPEVQPRPAAVATAGDGTYQVSVDPGTFDITMATPQGSGFPWLVRPRHLVSGSTDAASPPVESLGDLRLQSPVVVRGVVLNAQGSALPGAKVRAWISVGEAAADGLAPSAVQIGEAVADESGAYVLLLPPSIKEGK